MVITLHKFWTWTKHTKTFIMISFSSPLSLLQEKGCGSSRKCGDNGGCPMQAWCSQQHYLHTGTEPVYCRQCHITRRSSGHNQHSHQHWILLTLHCHRLHPASPLTGGSGSGAHASKNNTCLSYFNSLPSAIEVHLRTNEANTATKWLADNDLF